MKSKSITYETLMERLKVTRLINTNKKTVIYKGQLNFNNKLYVEEIELVQDEIIDENEEYFTVFIIETLLNNLIKKIEESKNVI